MQLLANENIAGEIVTALRDVGHDVAWIATDSPGASDSDVLRRATAEGRIVLTYDKDFGELAFREQLSALPGIILLRVREQSPAAVTQIIVGAIQERDDWPGHFSVIENRRVRMTALR